MASAAFSALPSCTIPMRTLMAMTPMISPASSTKQPIVDTAIRALLREDLLAGTFFIPSTPVTHPHRQVALCSCPRSPPLRLSYNHFVCYTTYDPACEYAAAAAVSAAAAVCTCSLHTTFCHSVHLIVTSQLLLSLAGYIASATVSWSNIVLSVLLKLLCLSSSAAPLICSAAWKGLFIVTLYCHAPVLLHISHSARCPAACVRSL